MKTKILIFIATTMMCTMYLFAQEPPQRDATTGHSEVTNNEATFGETYFFGGQKEDGSLSNELWVTNGWGIWGRIDVPGGPSPRKDHVSYIRNEKLYIQGGIDANGNCLNDWWEFSLIDNTWTLISTNPGINCASKKTAVKVNNNIYIAGGTNSSGASVSDFGVLTSSGYTPKANMIEPLTGCGSFKKNGNVYIFGGKNHDWDPNTPGNQPSYSQNVWKYNVTTDSWTLQTTSKSQIIELTDMAYTQDTLENFFYVFGGKTYDYGTNTETYINEIYKLDLNTFVWTKSTTTLPYGLANFTATYKHGTNFNTDTIFLLGGQKSSVSISTNLFKFIPSSGQIITVPLVTSINSYTIHNIHLYPNPATDILFIKNTDRNSIVIIYDITGKQVLNTKVENEKINISELPKGFYTIRIKSESNEIINKFVKQ